jgi:hypothetical protein
MSADPFGIEQGRPVAAVHRGVLDRVLGIDPGIEGALGLLTVPGWDVVCTQKLPTRVEFDRRVVDERALAQVLQQLAPSLVVIEKVQPMPDTRDELVPAAGGVTTAAKVAVKRHRMGTVGAFNYGFTCAQIYATVRLAGHDPILVHPATWKAAAGLRGRGAEYADRKRMSLALARQLWPQDTIPNDGCAEALLIARFGFASQLRFF